ncbi:MAG TPA: DUF4340 domain-containing protein [Verrucomicrobiae bacterium]|nr:DUF4340 domain-containing protein [Verrucomicrobiae bacterium]
MNRKQFAIIVVLLIIVGGAGLLVQSHHNAAAGTGAQEQGGKLLGNNFPINDVAAISIQQGTNQLNVVKVDDLWRVRERNNYAADFSKISAFLVKAADLKILETEQVDAADLPRLQLAAAGQGSDAGVLLTLKDKDGKTLKALTLGKSHFQKPAQQSQFGGDESFPDGRYVMAAGDTHNVLLVRDPFSEAEPKPETWLNKDFFKVERPKTIAITYPDATNSWQISRTNDSGEWKLAGLKPGQTENTTNLPSVTSPFAAPSFEDVMASTTKPEDTGLDKPTTITVDTFDDFTYTVKVGKKNGDNYPITMTVVANFPTTRIPASGEKPEDKDKADKAWQERQKQLDATLKQAQAYQNWIYLVSGWSLDSLLKDRKDLVVEKADEPKPASKSDSTAKDDPNAPLAVPDPPAAKQ